MGKLLEFKTRAQIELEKLEPLPPDGGASLDAEAEAKLEEFRRMFTNDEVDSLKDELDFLNELDDLGISDTPDSEKES